MRPRPLSYHIPNLEPPPSVNDFDLPSAQVILEKAQIEGRDTYRLGLSRTLNPYMSTQIRDAWFAGYDDGAAS